MVSSVPETLIPLNVGGWFTVTVTVVEMVLKLAVSVGVKITGRSAVLLSVSVALAKAKDPGTVFRLKVATPPERVDELKACPRLIPEAVGLVVTEGVALLIAKFASWLPV